MNREEMLARQQELLDLARSAGRELTTEEAAEFDDLQGRMDAAQTGSTTGAQANTGEGAATGTEAARAATEAERQRSADIIALCRQTGMEPDQYINGANTVDQVRKAAVDHLIRNGAPVAMPAREQKDNFRQAATDAMLIRSGVTVNDPARGAEDMAGLSLRDLAIECMVHERQGTTTSLLRMSKDELFNNMCRQFYNPTAAFPAIMDTTIKKVIKERYKKAATTFDLWTSKGSVADFKPTRDHEYAMGGAGDFLLVGESGEIKADKPSTSMAPWRKIDTYARQLSMTRQAFINDDIGFITNMPGKYAAAAKRTINKQVYQVLMSNPAIYDGVSLFDASTHKNLIATGAKPSIETIQALMMLLMKQVDEFGDAITVDPKHIIVPVGYGFLMSQLLETSEISVDGIGEHTKNALYNYRNKLVVVEEGMLNTLAGTAAAPWFVVGDQETAKSIQVDYLNGQETPTIRRMETPGQLGFVWDMYLDWGITVMDYRGIAKNPGVVLG